MGEKASNNTRVNITGWDLFINKLFLDDWFDDISRHEVNNVFALVIKGKIVFWEIDVLNWYLFVCFRFVIIPINE